jgi:hypothetical protein
MKEGVYMCGQKEIEKLHRELDKLQEANYKNNKRIESLEDAHNKNKNIIRRLTAILKLMFIKGTKVFEIFKKEGKI